MLHVEVGRRAGSIAEGSLVGAAFRGSSGGRHDGEEEGWMDVLTHLDKAVVSQPALGAKG